MKKILSALAALSITLSGISAYAATDVNVNFNGKKMEFDVNPFIDGDRTLVPVRAIFEAVGAHFTWNDELKTVIAAYEKNGEPTFITLQIDTKSAFVNGEKKELDVPPRIVDGRTFMPLRFVMEELGADVTWDSSTYTVNIKTE